MHHKNCWVVLYKERFSVQQRVLSQRASATTNYELFLHESLSNGTESALLTLDYYDADGKRTRIARTLIRRSL